MYEKDDEIMDNNVFIDKETFKIYEDYPKVFNCDKKIASVVATLNKKGYVTKASCEGHIEFGWDEIDDCDISLLDAALNRDSYIVLRQRTDSFDYLTRHEITAIYILFEQDYDFKNIPDGFKLETDCGYALSRTIYYYKNNIRRDKKELEKEKDKYLEILNDWANKLPLNEN